MEAAEDKTFLNFFFYNFVIGSLISHYYRKWLKHPQSHFYWAIPQKSNHFLLFWCILCTTTQDISSSSKNINNMAHISKLSFRFLWLWAQSLQSFSLWILYINMLVITEYVIFVICVNTEIRKQIKVLIIFCYKKYRFFNINSNF